MKTDLTEQQWEKLIANAPQAPQEPTQGQELVCQDSNKLTKKQDELLASNFPLRHVLKIEEMHGKGLEKAKSLEPKVNSGDALILLVGDNGPGKTQIATYFAYCRLTAQKYAGYYIKANDLMSVIKSSYGGTEAQKQQAEKLVKRVRSTAYLVIDEFKELTGTAHENATMTNLIDHRYDSMRSTVIISNDNEKTASETVGRSIWSRATETGGLVLCDWSSYRNKVA